MQGGSGTSGHTSESVDMDTVYIGLTVSITVGLGSLLPSPGVVWVGRHAGVVVDEGVGIFGVLNVTL